MNTKTTSTTNRSVIATKSGRGVYVPKGATAYIIEPGGELPDELKKIIEQRAQVLAEDKVYEFKQQQNLKSVNARVPTTQEMAADVIKLVAPHSEAEQNQVVAIVLHRLKQHRKLAMTQQQESLNTMRDILQGMQEADNQLDAITLGNFHIIE